METSVLGRTPFCTGDGVLRPIYQLAFLLGMQGVDGVHKPFYVDVAKLSYVVSICDNATHVCRLFCRADRRAIPYYSLCAGCSVELTSSAREVRTRPGYTANELNELYCLRCHDKMGIPICGACRYSMLLNNYTALR